MEVKTKYNIGDNLTFLWHGRKSWGVVDEIGIGITGNGVRIQYYFIGVYETRIVSEHHIEGYRHG